MKYVNIERTNSSFDGLALGTILRAIHKETEGLVWSIQFIQGVGDISGVVGFRMLELEKRCHMSPHGVIISYEKLLEMAEACDDIVDLLVVGCVDEGSVPKAYREENWEEKCEVVFLYEDSTIWSLYARDPAVMAIFESLQSQE